jgi:hypothetical protein
MSNSAFGHFADDNTNAINIHSSRFDVNDIDVQIPTNEDQVDAE